MGRWALGRHAWLIMVVISVMALSSCGNTSEGSDASGGSTMGSGGEAGTLATGGSTGASGPTGGSGGSGPFEGPCIRNVVGDVTVLNQAELDALQDVCSIEGNLFLGGDMTHIELPWLEVVTGELRVAFNSTLVELDLPALHSLGQTGDAYSGVVSGLFVGEASRLTSIQLPALEATSLISVFAVPSLTDFDLSSLTTLDSFSLGPAGLAHIDLPSLTEGGIRLNANDFIEELNAPHLISGDLWVTQCPRLGALSFPEATEMKGIQLSLDDALTSLSFPVLESMSTVLDIHKLPALTELSFPALTATQSVEITVNDALTSVSLPLLETIDDNFFRVAENPSLESISVPALTLGSEPRIEQNPLLTMCEGQALEDVPECQ